MAHAFKHVEDEKKLAKLNSECQDLLRSGIAITSVAQCVEELVLNSLDAGATCVAVRVDLPCGRIQCVDNGVGLTKEQLERVAHRYATSKCENLDDITHNLGHYGYRGEALASMRSIAAVLEIQTRASTKTYIKEFVEGKAKVVVQATVQRPSAGTTITVHDLFHRLPVRKKHLNVNLELEQIRQRMEGIALIHPWIAFSLRNDDNNQLILKTCKSNSVAATFAKLFTSSKSKGLCDISNVLDDFEVKGYVSKEGHHNKNLQFVYVNGRLVLKSKVHRVLNWMISRSSISRKRHEVLGENGSPARMTSERYGIYVINITCPLSQYDITFDPTKTLVEFKSWGTLLRCLQKAVGDFLVHEGLKGEKADLEESPDLRKFLDAGDTETKKEQDDVNDDDDSVTKYGTNISTWQSVNNKHSIAVRRPRQFPSIQDLVKDEHLSNEAESTMRVSCSADETAVHSLQILLANAGHSEELISQSDVGEYNVRSGNSNDVPNTAPGVRDKTFLSLSDASDQPFSSVEFTSLSSRNSASMSDRSSAAEGVSIGSVQSGIKKSADPRNTTKGTQCYRSSLQKFKRQIGKPSLGSRSETKGRLPKEEILANFDVIRQKLRRRKVTSYPSHKTIEKSDSISSSLAASVTDVSCSDAAVSSSGGMPIFHIPIDQDGAYDSVQHIDDAVPSTSAHTWPQLSAEVDSSRVEKIASSLPDFPFCEQLSTDVCLARKRKVPVKASYAAKLSKISGYEKNGYSVSKNSREFLSTGSLVQPVQNFDFLDLPSSKDGRPDEGHQDIIVPHYAVKDYSLETEEAVADADSSNSSSGQFTKLCDSSSQKERTADSHSFRSSVRDVTAKSHLVTQSSGMSCSYETTSGTYGLHTAVNDLVSSLPCFQPENSSSATSGITNKKSSFRELEYTIPDIVCTKTQIDNDSYEGNVVTKSHDLEKSAAEVQLQHQNSKTICDEPTSNKNTSFVPVFLDNPFKKRKRTVTGEVSDVTVENDRHESTISEMRSGKAENFEVKNITHGSQQKEIANSVDPKKTGQKFASNVVKEGYVLPPGQNKHNEKDQAESCDIIKLGQCVIGNTDTSNKLVTATRSATGKSCDDTTVSADEYRVTDSSSCQSTPHISIPTFTSPSVYRETQGFSNFAEGYSQGFELAGPCTQEFSVSLDDDCDLEDDVAASPKFGDSNSTKESKKCDTRQPSCQHAAACDLTHSGQVQHVDLETSKNSRMMADSITSNKNLISKRPSYVNDSETLRNACDNDKAMNHLGNVKTDAVEQKKTPIVSLSSHRTSEDHDAECLYTSGHKPTMSTRTSSDTNMTAINTDICLKLANPMSDGQMDSGEHKDSASAAMSEGMLTQVLPIGNFATVQKSTGADASGCATLTTGAEPVSVESLMSEDLLSSAAAVSEGVEESFVGNNASQSSVTELSCDDVEVTDAELLAMDAKASAADSKKAIKKDSTTLFIGPSWICKIDPLSGDKVYVNRITGCSSLEKPSLSGDEISAVRSKKSALSTSKTHKLLSGTAAVFLQQVEQERSQRQQQKNEEPEEMEESAEIKDLVDNHLENLDFESIAIKWRQGSVPHEYEQIDGHRDGPPLLSAESMQDKSSQFESRLHYAIHPQKITKSMLNSMKVIGQVDNKFISCLMQKEDQLGRSSDLNACLLVVIDQHAAHERIRLEQLTDEIYVENDSTTLKSSKLDPALELTMQPEDLRLMTVYRKHLTSLGITFENDHTDQTSIKVTSLPKCFIDEKTSQLKEGRASVTPSVIQIMLKKRLEVLQTTGGVCATLPLEVHHLLCLDACHGAVKFGDELSAKECSLLVDNLCSCKLPFQCAHGRPSVMPLLDLQKLASLSESAKKSKPRLKNLKLKMEEERALISSNHF